MKKIVLYSLLFASLFLGSISANSNISNKKPQSRLVESLTDTIPAYKSAIYKSYLSPAVFKLLQEYLPEWKLPEPNSWDKFWFDQYKKETVLVNYISADFNGDHKKDYCLILKNSKNDYAVWVLQSNKKNYLPIKIFQAKNTELPITMGLELVSKGKLNYLNLDNDGPPKTIDLQNAAIQVVFFEASAELYYWKNGKYLSVTTGD